MNAYVSTAYPTVQVGFVITSRAATDPTLVLSNSGGLRAVDVFSSSAATLGSVNLQSEFYCEVFKAWDTHSTRIPSLAILRMVDKTRTDAQNVATVYGLPGNEAFIEYIRTLGIQTQDGTAKSTFNMVRSELQKRGF
jgi:hypothetical protein